MLKYYYGLTVEGFWQVFTADKPEDATPEITGYIAVTKGVDTLVDLERLGEDLPAF